MEALQFQGISQNLKYIFTNRGVIQTGEYFKNRENGKFIDYSYQNLDIAVGILKEHTDLFYKAGKISLTEYANSARKFVYRIVEIIHPEHQVKILKEWEEVFGSKLLLINESTDSNTIEKRITETWDTIKLILIEGDWYNPLSWDWKGAAKNVYDWGKDTVKGAVEWGKEQGKQIKEKGLWGYAKDKASAVWNSVKDAVSKAWKCLTNNFVECLMEGIRTASFSAVGMGVMTAISFIPGVGQVADFLLFGSLLIWDIYKALSGKYESGQYQWSWVDIIVDAVCLLLPAIGGALKYALKGVRGAAEIGVKAATEGGVIAKAVKAITGGLSKIIGYIGKAAAWIGEKLGITWLSKFGAKAESFMTKASQEMSQGAASKGVNIVTQTEKGSFKKDVLQKIVPSKQAFKDAKTGLNQFIKNGKFTKPVPVVLKSTGKTIMITAALCAALGLSDPWMCHNKVESGEVSEEQIKQAEAEMAKSLGSTTNLQKLDQLTDEESKDIFGF